MLVTGLVPGGSPPPVGVGKDPFHLSAAEAALASSWLQPGNPEESWAPSPRRRGHRTRASATKLCALLL